MLLAKRHVPHDGYACLDEGCHAGGGGMKSEWHSCMGSGYVAADNVNGEGGVVKWWGVEPL